MLEYPGGHLSMDSHGTSVLPAGGVGITHQIPYTYRLLEGSTTRRIARPQSYARPGNLSAVAPWSRAPLTPRSQGGLLLVSIYYYKWRYSGGRISSIIVYEFCHWQQGGRIALLVINKEREVLFHGLVSALTLDIRLQVKCHVELPSNSQ
jgi:hypothetical protein